MSKQQNAALEVAVNEKDLREGIMPRALLSKAACESKHTIWGMLD